MSRQVFTKTITVTKDGVTTQQSLQVSIPMFPERCEFCNRDNVCSKPGNCCGRILCREAWRLKKYGSLDDQGKADYTKNKWDEKLIEKQQQAEKKQDNF